MGLGFDISSLDFNTSSLNENHISSIREKTRDMTDSTYFEEACQFCLKINEDFNNASKNFYRSILESTEDNRQVITESFDDFFSKIKEIIDKVIAFIKKIIDKFILGLNKIIRSSDYLKKHKKDFDKFKSSDNFTFHNGYNYTFDFNIPSLRALEDFNNDFVYGGDDKYTDLKTALDKLEKIDKDKTADIKTHSEEIIKILDKYYKDLTYDLENNYYDRFRARVLNRPEKEYITEADYADELFCEYRDGTSDSEDIDVDSAYIRKAYDRFEGYDKHISRVKKDQKNIEKEYNSLKKNIEGMSKNNYRGSSITLYTNPGDPTPITVAYTPALLDTINTYFKAKVNQVQEISNIHTLAFSAKLDAINNSYKQDKSVLYMALQKMSAFTRPNDESAISLAYPLAITEWSELPKPLPINIEDREKVGYSFAMDDFKKMEFK